MKKDKIIVILGSTASGKSDLAVDLAKKYNGEVISADSRQVFKGLDIGSGKITKKEMKGIPHYLLDIASPNKAFSVTQFQKKSNKIIKDILKRGKLPIIAGGTGFYIQSIVDNIVLPEVKPNNKLRKELEKKSTEELAKLLKKLDKSRAGEIDLKNPRRLVRAIEIATALGKVPKLKITNGCSTPCSGVKRNGGVEYPENNFRFFQIGIKIDDEVLKDRIKKRFKKRVRVGIVVEAEKLYKKGLSWKRMNELGLAHKYISKFLRGKISKKEMIENSIKEEWWYAKRQKTWFKRDQRIKWFESKNKKKIEGEVRDFLTN